MEHLIRKCIDPELDILADLHLPDIGLGDVRRDVHLGDVLGDSEQHRRAHGGNDRLSLIHLARNHDAIDRRGDLAVTQVRLGAVQRRFLDGDGRLSLCQLRRCLIQIEL